MEPISLTVWIWAVAFFVFGATFYGAPALLGLPESFATGVGGIAIVLMVLGGLVLVWRSLAAIGAALTGGRDEPRHQDILVALLISLSKIVAVVAAALILAETFSLSYTSVLAALGVGGIALALAAQSTIANILAGFTIYADRPISVGQFCKFGDHLGTVERIGLRSTRLRSIDRTLITVPNSELVNVSLENYSRRDRILLKAMVKLRCETTPDQLRHVLAELRRMLMGHPRIADEDLRVRFVDMGESSLNVELYAYALTTEHAAYLAIREDVLFRMIHIVAASGSGFAFPSQVTYQAEDRGLDADRTRTAEEQVTGWRERGELPFPEFSDEAAAQARNTLDWPPKGAAKDQVAGEPPPENAGKREPGP